MAGHPKNIIFLTADAYGVMPPIAKLTPAQAMYHFLSGYTAKVAGTEKGLVGVEPEFSTCFGAPFLPRPPAEYGNLLRDYIAKHKVDHYASQVNEKRHGAQGRARMTLRNMLATIVRKNGKAIGLDGDEYAVNLPKPALTGAAKAASEKSGQATAA